MNTELPPGIRAKLGAAIRRRRAALRVSQEELAHQVSLHRTYISDIERGCRNVSIENIAKIAGALGLKVYELLQLAEEDADETQ